MSMKNSIHTIGNRSRDLPVCSAVPQPLRHRVPVISNAKIMIVRTVSMGQRSEQCKNVHRTDSHTQTHTYTGCSECCCAHIKGVGTDVQEPL
jgi:hypothetical protein